MMKESDPPNEQPESVAFRKNLEKLKLDLGSINQGIRTYIMGQRIDVPRGPPRYLIGDEDDDKTEVGDPVFDGDEDDDSQSLIQCTFCDFMIDFSAVCNCLEGYDPDNMLCPVCDEKLGDEAIRVIWNSISQKRTWKSDTSSVSSVDSLDLDEKLPVRGTKHEPVPDPLLSLGNVSVPKSGGIHTSEGSSCKASDITKAEGAVTDSSPDSGDEKDAEERRLTATFVQELVLSTLI
uniref:Uncharacterized protein n=1 Tax=Cajanus cajan TaxID=3821 RepID=A0A151TRJ0_CAJCA|nr:hypothetical protein KK1_008840 [Cajanus cajan]